jgi:signal transduction histidine kinase
MFKKKIAYRLSAYFAVALVIFSIIVGSLFLILFRQQTLELNRIEMVTRSESIANSLSVYMSSGRGQGGMSGYGAYMRFIGDIAGTDVWIIDSERNLIIGEAMMRQMGENYVYSDLPKSAEDLISKIFTGEIAFSEEFGEVLQESTLTVGTPIIVEGQVVGAVLMHSSIKGTNDSIVQGFILFILSAFISLIIAIIFSVGFSLSFTRPLRKMKDISQQLAQGDYTVKTMIHQEDEVGDLAQSLDELALQLDKASTQSQQLEKLRRDFVANISHELRTPITVIRGSLEALIDDVVTKPDQVKEYERQMLSETLFLQRLVGDLLDLSRLQNTSFEMEKVQISLNEIIKDVSRSLQPLLKDKNMALSISDTDADWMLLGDYGRIRQMLMIILDNGIKFSKPGDRIEIVLKDKLLTVQDFGIGIDEEELPHIFERFYKSRSELNKTGTGLGLAIAKEIARKHDIQIKVSSSMGKGTTFIFTP